MNERTPIVKSETGKVRGPMWSIWLRDIAHQPHVRGLELGTFKGESAEYMLDNIFTDPTSSYTCVDWFQGSAEHEYKGIDVTKTEAEARSRLEKYKNCLVRNTTSLDFFLHSDELLNYFDFIYVDADHSTPGVLTDSVVAFYFLKKGGIMVFDDYQWRVMPNVLDNPKIGIDAFLTCFADRIQVIAMGYQIAIKKL